MIRSKIVIWYPPRYLSLPPPPPPPPILPPPPSHTPFSLSPFSQEKFTDFTLPVITL